MAKNGTKAGNQDEIRREVKARQRRGGKRGQQVEGFSLQAVKSDRREQSVQQRDFQRFQVARQKGIENGNRLITNARQSVLVLNSSTYMAEGVSPEEALKLYERDIKDVVNAAKRRNIDHGEYYNWENKETNDGPQFLMTLDRVRTKKAQAIRQQRQSQVASA